MQKITNKVCNYIVTVYTLVQLRMISSTVYRCTCRHGNKTLKVTGYSCARRVKCIGKSILKLANQKSLVRRV